ncbi:MAG: cell wall-binding repeat-containing protein [Euzebya sp.]
MNLLSRSRVLPVVVVCLALGLAFVVSPPASAVEDVTPARIEGPERTATAAAIAAQAFPQGTRQAVIATADTAQDALTATALAGASNAAILLVRQDTVPPATATALQELGVTDIILVGSVQSISQAVASELAQDYSVTRLAGQNQYDTAVQVATEAVDIADLPSINGLRSILLASGENFPDALAGSPAAYAGPTPVLYAEPGNLPDEVSSFMDRSDVEQVVILGGTAAISESVATQIRSDGRAVVRLGGADRVETATIVAEWTQQNYSFTEDSIMLARGDDFPDALTAGQLGGRFGRPLVLSANPDLLPRTALTYFATRCDVIEVVQAIGGQAALSTAVLQSAETAAETCSDLGGGSVGDDALPDFAVTPLLLETDPGLVDTVSVSGLGDVQSLDVALFPCDLVQIDGDGSALFPVFSSLGFADGYGTTQTGTSLITGINNANIEDKTVVPGAQAQDGRLGIQVSAFDPDCAVVVAVPAQGNNPGVPVDSQGRPTVRYGVAEVRFGAVPESGTSSHHVYLITPTGPVDATVGTATGFVVEGRFDGRPITRTLTVVLFPCDKTQVFGSGPDVFTDADNDGGADGFGASETGAIMITAINGQPAGPDTAIGGVQAASDGRVTFEVNNTTGTDCATIAVVAGNGNGKFDVNSSDIPIEDYGVAQVRYG